VKKSRLNVAQMSKKQLEEALVNAKGTQKSKIIAEIEVRLVREEKKQHRKLLIQALEDSKNGRVYSMEEVKSKLQERKEKALAR
jgi:hypothetical protein